MSGIGNAIETDLVGELVDLIDIDTGSARLPSRDGRTSAIPGRPPSVTTRASGLVRAAMSDDDGGMIVWIEIREQRDIETVGDRYGAAFTPRIGDVLRWGVGRSTVIRLRRGGS